MQKKIFVLIIEFHKDWEPFYRKILQHEGYVVETLVTNNSEDAVKAITDFQPDLVIYRPGLDYELLNIAIRIYQIYSTTRPKNLVICTSSFIPQEYLFLVDKIEREPLEIRSFFETIERLLSSGSGAMRQGWIGA